MRQIQAEGGKRDSIIVLCGLWVLTFGLYLPAIKAGWVIDASWMVYYYRHQGFWDYLNRVQSPAPSLYQFTQLVTYGFLKIFDTNVYAWHLLQVTMHAINAWLLYTICKRLLRHAGVYNASTIALTGVGLFTICPHLSEVVVWEACYHYLQGFMMILVSLLLVQKYHYTQKTWYAWVSGIVYLCATYSLEIFYLTPWFVLSMAVYYRYTIGGSAVLLRRVLLLFFVPQLALFGAHLAVLSAVYAHFAHLPDSVIQPASSYLIKVPKLLFHLLLLGRYYPTTIREYVYAVCETSLFLVVFYGVLAAGAIFAVARRRRFATEWRFGLLLLVWVVLAVIIIIPLPFPISGMLMFYDRYLYLLSGFGFVLLAYLASHIANAYVRVALLVLYALPMLYLTVKVNIYWKHSAYINNRLLQDIPRATNKTIILLNIPENMNGIAMIGSQPEGEYKRMRETFVDNTLTNKVYDAASYNMVTKDNGAHVKVLNDSTVQVILNQWGTWWWYEGHGGRSYETDDYRLDMKDVGHMYELTLKHRADGYLLLYSYGDMWKPVDMAKKDVAQY